MLYNTSYPIYNLCSVAELSSGKCSLMCMYSIVVVLYRYMDVTLYTCCRCDIHCVQKKHPLLFSCITLRKNNQFE